MASSECFSLDVCNIPNEGQIAVENLSLSPKLLQGSLSTFLCGEVEPASCAGVPNHLLETKVFTQEKNEDIFVKPAVLHFSKFVSGSSQKLTLQIINTSVRSQKIHIIPPQTEFFSISYTKKGTILPGLKMTVNIVFTPQETRYYYDCIRIHCQNNKNLLIPIHATEAQLLPSFPEALTFPALQCGESKTLALPLKNDMAAECSFWVTIVQDHPAFTYHPRDGVIPGMSEKRFFITFKPVNLEAACAEIHLHLLHFDSTPLTCVITGSTEKLPFISETEKVLGDSSAALKSVNDATETSTEAVDGTAASKSSRLLLTTSNESLLQPCDRSESDVVESAGLALMELQQSVLEESMDSLKRDIASIIEHETSDLRLPEKQVFQDKVFERKHQAGQQKNILFLKKHKSKSSSRCEDVLVKVNKKYASSKLSRMDKEKIFLDRCKKIDKEDSEKIDVKHGFLPLTSETKAELSQTEEAMVFMSEQSVLGSDVATVSLAGRTCRSADDTVIRQPSFDRGKINLWAQRQRTLERFIAATWKVIYRCRMEKRLRKIKDYLAKIQFEQCSVVNIEGDMSSEDVSDITGVESKKALSFEKISKTKSLPQVDFLTGHMPGQYDLSQFPAPPRVGKCDLGIYNKLPMPDVATSNIPDISLHDINFNFPQNHECLFPEFADFPGIERVEVMYLYFANKCLSKKHLEGELATDLAESVESSVTISKPSSKHSVEETEPRTVHSEFTVPQELINAPKYSPLHIFDPAPGTQPTARKLPYSVTDYYFPNKPIDLQLEEYREGLKTFEKWQEAMEHLPQVSNIHTGTTFNMDVVRYNENMLPTSTPEYLKINSFENVDLVSDIAEAERAGSNLRFDAIKTLFRLPESDEKSSKHHHLSKVIAKERSATMLDVHRFAK